MGSRAELDQILAVGCDDIHQRLAKGLGQGLVVGTLGNEIGRGIGAGPGDLDNRGLLRVERPSVLLEDIAGELAARADGPARCFAWHASLIDSRIGEDYQRRI